MAKKPKQHKLLVQFIEYLISGGVYFWDYNDGAAHNVWDPNWTMDIGQPSGAMYGVGTGAFRRSPVFLSPHGARLPGPRRTKASCGVVIRLHREHLFRPPQGEGSGA